MSNLDLYFAVTPSHPEAETFVNQQRIMETTILGNGYTVRFGGRGPIFRFIDPLAEERERLRYQASSVTLPEMTPSYGNYAHFGPGGPRQNPQQPLGMANILPAVLEFREETEEAFFNSITANLEVNAVNFKLAPTYTIYMATRFRASTHYRPELIPEERAVRLTEMLNAVAECIFGTVEAGQNNPSILAFWMANASELLHFLKSDRHITAFSLQAQDILAETVHMAFKFLVGCLQSDLEMFMPSMLNESDDDDSATSGCLQVLGSAMALLRKCRVNAALTIQLFSQLFHFINMWTFNKIVSSETTTKYCTCRWGQKIKKRMGRVEQWAEKQGLELAADCHLARIVQAAHLLMARKNTAEDIASLSSICFKLNSVQLRTLLHKYEAAPDENPISKEMIDTIVRVAEATVDETTNAEGRAVTLEEDFVLQLPFLLPEDGYSSDIVRGVPGGLTEFLAPLQSEGLCVMTPQPTSSGYWTIYMDNAPAPMATPIPRSPSEMSQATLNNGDMHPAQMQHLQMQQRGMLMSGPGGNPGNEPEIQTIQLVKGPNGGMGLSIVAAKGVGKDRLGIYVKAVVEGGAAFHDGRLQGGDQLLKVDGHSLVGITQERAAEIMTQTGQVVELEVAKQGAIYHGLAQLLSQPSPVLGGGRPPQGSPMRPQAPPQMLPPQQQQQQHLYQNHRPGPSPSARPQGNNMRSASIQNLMGAPMPPPPGSPQGMIPPGAMQRQASHPALMNGGRPASSVPGKIQ